MVKNCKSCGKVFKADVRNRQLCNECRTPAPKKVKKEAKRKAGSIHEDIQSLEEYNKRHKTAYTYGQAKSKGII